MDQKKPNPVPWKDYLHLTLLFVLCSVLLVTRKQTQERFLETFSGKQEEETVIVLDAGHGGEDPGKVGTANTLEKEINLAIAKKVARLLEEDRITVVMTRTQDCSLAPAAASNKKREDMKERVRRINEAAPRLAVSIHQNSFPSADCRGAQMFYYRDSAEGERLAKLLQAAFAETVDAGNQRKAKANSEYYLLRKVSCPLVIAECGFLSSPEEEALLKTEEYQEKVAEAVRAGIIRYLQTEQTDPAAP